MIFNQKQVQIDKKYLPLCLDDFLGEFFHKPNVSGKYRRRGIADFKINEVFKSSKAHNGSCDCKEDITYNVNAELKERVLGYNLFVGLTDNVNTFPISIIAKVIDNKLVSAKETYSCGILHRDVIERNYSNHDFTSSLRLDQLETAVNNSDFRELKYSNLNQIQQSLAMSVYLYSKLIFNYSEENQSFVEVDVKLNKPISVPIQVHSYQGADSKTKSRNTSTVNEEYQSARLLIEENNHSLGSLVGVKYLNPLHGYRKEL